MLTEICAEIHNYFCQDKHFGKFTISGGSMMPLDFLKKGQYFRIVGSVFNDGVYQYPANGLIDEEFEGAVWTMAVPVTFLLLVEEIRKSVEKTGVATPYASESYPNGYSYSAVTGNNGIPVSWKQLFASQLNQYRRFSEQ